MKSIRPASDEVTTWSDEWSATESEGAAGFRLSAQVLQAPTTRTAAPAAPVTPQAVLPGTSGNDSLTGSSSADTITGVAGNDTLLGLAGNDSLDGGTGNDSLDGGTGNDTLIGGTGNDTYIVDASGDVTTETSTLATEIDTVISAVSRTLGSNLEHLTLSGSSVINGSGNTLNNKITGNTANNVLGGSSGNDTLLGLGGNDTLDGGAGNDSMDGGTGNDSYVVDVSGDLTTETSTLATEIDTVTSAVSRTLGANLENLTLSGANAINGTGNTLNNKLTGNGAFNVLTGSSGNDTLLALGGNDSLDGGSGNDSLDGGTGNDILSGGTGNDVYVVDALADLISETSTVATEIDSVVSSQTWTLGANLEKLTLSGSSAINGSGNTLNNTITGNGGANVLNGDAGNDTLLGGNGNDSLSAGAGNDSLDGGSGADTLVGSTGNDLYIVDSAGDVTTETSTVLTEIDTVVSSVTRTLSTNIERLTLAGNDPIDGTGNTLANLITGNGGVNVLNGGDGNDTLTAGGGNDSLVGGNGNDSLDGQAGTDTMVGSSGNDVYIVDASTDVISETGTLATEIDSVTSAVTYTLSANVERLTITGSANLNGIGNGSANFITGNTGNNSLAGSSGNDTLVAGAGNDILDGGSQNDSLDGGTGNDLMSGGTGSDIYVVDSATDVVTESTATGAGEVDTVISSVNWVLGANFENLTLTGSAMLFASGNSLANKIIGNGAANLISAGSGHDSVDGGAGNDTVLGSTGNDTLKGGGDADELDGGDGGDSLDGGLGIDTMEGGSGNDIYVVDAAGDVTNETSTIANEIDKVFSSVTRTLGANIENLALTGAAAINGTGNALNNTIEGNSGLNQLNGGEGNDTLFSAGGNDTLTGGAGDDDFYVASASDVVVELLNGGTDWINTSLATYSLVELANVENLTNTADGAVDFTGNALNNQIYGAAADDTLNGGAGNDTMFGGGGGDRYTVDATDDVIEEAVDAGFDSVNANASVYTLSANLESLAYIGTENFYGTGNALDNYVWGNTGADTLDGGAGNDTMVGLGGNDKYTVDAVGDIASENGDAGIDTVYTTLAGYTLGNHVENLNYLGSSNFNGVGNALANAINGSTGNDSLSGGDDVDTLVGSGGNDTLVGGTGADVFFGGSGNDVFDIDSIDDRPGEDPNNGTDLIITSLTGYTLADNFEDLQFSGSGPFVGTGNALGNVIRSDSGTGNDVLSGGGGADSLNSGSGNDTLRAGDGLDTLTGGSGFDTFIIDSFGSFFAPKTTSDTITDFVGGTDKFGFVPADGDLTIGNPGFVNFVGSGVWSSTFFLNELIIFGADLSDLSANTVAGFAAATVFVDPNVGFEIPDNRTVLMAFDNGVDTVVYRYDNVVPFVQAPEFTLLATLTGTAFTNIADYVFVTG